ncbi:MAG: dTDP-Rha--alpha-D-GlcNAc-pyrophosphate polyprenol alpha-3-L-rhamnosyltransferase, partial [Rhodococcus sp. (in: high G+C Gram-positive bacteria)]
GRHPELMLPAHHSSAYRFQADRHPHPWQAPLRWALRAGLAARSKVVVASALRVRQTEERQGDARQGDDNREADHVS